MNLGFPIFSVKDHFIYLNQFTSSFEDKIEDNNNVIVNFVNWIHGEVKREEQDRECKQASQLEKLVIVVQSKQDVQLTIAMTKKLQVLRTMKEESFQSIICQESTSKEEPYWPARWYLHIELKGTDVLDCINHIWCLKHVECLTLCGSKTLDILPLQIINFKHLKYLNLQGNKLSDLPYTLQFCDQLEVIKLECNNFERLPDFLTRLSNLTILTRDGNHFDFSISNKFVRKEKKTEKKNCDSLKQICLKAAMRPPRNYIVDHDYMVDLPRYLKKDFFTVINGYCGDCNQAIVREEGYMYAAIRSRFVECSHVPVYGYACCEGCANSCVDQIEVENKHLNDLLQTTVYNCVEDDFENNFEMNPPRKQRRGLGTKLYCVLCA